MESKLIEKQIDLGECTIFYQQGGRTTDATPLLLIHGWAISAEPYHERLNLLALIQTNTDMDMAQAKEPLLAWSVDGKEGKLTLFNFNTPNLCGALGCLYTGYWLRENQPAIEVFQNYLNPNLPANKPLIQVGEDRGQALPCLEVLQMEGDRLRQLNYCFNGDSRSERLHQRYPLADSKLY
jgi:hypothetical protein